MEHLFPLATYNNLRLLAVWMSPIAVLFLLANLAYWCQHHYQVRIRTASLLCRKSPSLSYLHGLGTSRPRQPAFA
jgi:hypothetical protein